MSKEEVEDVFELVNGAKKTEKIELTSLTDWVVRPFLSLFYKYQLALQAAVSCWVMILLTALRLTQWVD